MSSKSLIFFFLFYTLSPYQGMSQGNLRVSKDPAEFMAAITNNPTLQLIELQTIVPNIRYDLKYATKDNFTGVRLYPSKTNVTFLRKEPALALVNIANELSTKGLGILVWDAYRPYHITVKFWELIKDERYVANPSKGSGHNRGIAIDMTLYDLKTGIPLEMPTGFDDFSEQAHHGANSITTSQKENITLLKSIMEKNGFIKFQTEWWHYYWPNGEQYDVLDFNFKEIIKLNSDAAK